MILAINIPCIIIPLLTGLLCGILGYLLGLLFSRNKINNFESSLNNCNKQRINLDSKLNELDKKSINLRNKLNAERDKNIKLINEFEILKNKSQSYNKIKLFNSVLVSEIFGRKIKENDLTIIEGIGPKIQNLFHNFNIMTWSDLSKCSIEKCKEILSSGGSRFLMHKPTTWPKQAEMATLGKWQELKKWQDELDGGN